VEPFQRGDLDGADGLFLVSSVRKITRVRVLDDVELPDSTDLHAELCALYESEY
jgi:4-amino-4-deoxychorismate lyase